MILVGPSGIGTARVASIVACFVAGLGALGAFPPPMPLAERVRAAELVLHVELRRVVVLDDRNPRDIQARAHIKVIEVLKGKLGASEPTIAFSVVRGSEEGDLVAPPAPGRYVLLLGRSKRGELELFRPNVYAWMKASDSVLRKVKLEALH